jgi:DNA repair exonuclease SbcCD ATPase subunit
MWHEVPVFLLVLVALPCKGTQSSLQRNRIKQPVLDDTQVFDELDDAPLEAEDSAGNDGPPVDNYVKLRQRNAEMAEQVQKLAHEAHVLKHRFKVTKLQEKFAREKIMKTCPTGIHGSGTASSHQQIKMPWSLTHTATRHKQKKGAWFPGEDTIKGLFDHFKSLGDHFILENTPRSYASAGTQGQLHRDVSELHRELKQTHVRLGRVHEVKGSLGEHYQAMRTKVTAMADAATKEQQLLDDLASNEQILDRKLAAVRETQRQKQKEEVAEAVGKDETDKESKVKEESEKLHQEAERRLNDSSAEIDRLKPENGQMQANVDAMNEKLPKLELELQNMQQSIKDGTDTATKLESEKVKLQEEENALKQKATSYDDKILDSSTKDEQCVEWTTKLEGKLKHVLQGKKDDGMLCHNSILGLHKERVSWKDGITKMHSEIKNLKRKTEEIQRKADENLATLNSCLGRST